MIEERSKHRISMDELGFWIQIYDEEKKKEFTVQQRLSRMYRAVEFLDEFDTTKERSDVGQKFFLETALRASVNMYIIAEGLKQ